MRDTQIRPNAAVATPAGTLGNQRRNFRRADTLYPRLTALPLGRHTGLHLRRPVSWRGASAEFRQDAGQALNPAWTRSGTCPMIEKALFLPDLPSCGSRCRQSPVNPLCPLGFRRRCAGTSRIAVIAPKASGFNIQAPLVLA